MNKLHNVLGKTKQLQKINAKRYELKRESKQLACEISTARGDAIVEMTKEFLHRVSSESELRDYCRSPWSWFSGSWNKKSDFITYVNRKGAISDRHRRAIEEWHDAFEKMNRVFVEELRANPEALRYQGGLKNLRKV